MQNSKTFCLNLLLINSAFVILANILEKKEMVLNDGRQSATRLVKRQHVKTIVKY